MRHIGQQTLPSVSHQGNTYTINNVRNYHRETEFTAKQQFTALNIDLGHITSCRLYQSAFGFGHIIAHYMIGFSYINKEGYEDEIVLSIEARRPEGQKYTLWKGMIPGMYSIIYTWGTPSDILSLRKHVWQDPLTSHDLKISQKQCQDLFVYFAHRTNTILHHQISYHAVFYNCLTDLHKGISHVTKKLFPITRWTIMSKGYIGYLRRNGLME